MSRRFYRRGHSRAGSILEGNHLSEEALLRLLDGELSSAEFSVANAHVLSCWACRSRRQAIEGAIGDLVEFHNKVAAPWLPPSPEGRAVFLARLEALAAELEKPSPLRRWLSAALRPVAALSTSRVAQIAAILIVTAAGFLAFTIRPWNSVSADEVLNRAMASEDASLRTTPLPVVVQKLRISVDGQSITRTIYHDTRRRQTVSRTDAQPQRTELERAAYERSALDWESPLDPESYRRWCRNHPGSTSRVIHHGLDRILLDTRLSSGTVTEAGLTLRARDYHAIEENFSFDDRSQLEIVELSWQVVPFAALSRGIFGAPLTAPAPQPPSIAALRPMLPSSAELAEEEIQAETVLHKLGADLGEQMNISIVARRKIMIEGIVADDQRRQQLTAALSVIPHAAVKLSTVGELTRQSSATEAADPSASSVQAMVAAPPLLEAELNVRFPDKDQRNTYVNQVMSLAQVASARAWALKRLADRHPSSNVAVLDEPSRRELRGLLMDHISALREDLSSLQNQLSLVLSRTSNTPAANTPTPFPDGPGETGAQEDWRERIRRIHSSTEAIHESAATLLTTSPADSGNDPTTIEVNLRTSLTQAEAELQALEEEIQKEVLN